MTNIFSFLHHTKVAKVVLSGEPDHSQPFGILLKGFFLFFKLFFKKRRTFKINVVYKKVIYNYMDIYYKKTVEYNNWNVSINLRR